MADARPGRTKRPRVSPPPISSCSGGARDADESRMMEAMTVMVQHRLKHPVVRDPRDLFFRLYSTSKQLREIVLQEGGCEGMTRVVEINMWDQNSTMEGLEAYERAWNTYTRPPYRARVAARVLPCSTPLGRTASLRSLFESMEAFMRQHEGMEVLDLSMALGFPKYGPGHPALRIEDDGTDILVNSLPCLQRLNLRGMKIKEGGVRTLTTKLGNLTHLQLSGNLARVQGAMAIAENCGKRLLSLDLEGNYIEDEVRSFSQWARLSISHACEILDPSSRTERDTWRRYADSNGIRIVYLIGITYQSSHFQGLIAIATSCTSLTSLGVANNNIGDDATAAIAANLPGLTALDIRDNGEISEQAMLRLARACTSLRILRPGDLRSVEVLTFVRNCTGLRDLKLEESSIGKENAKAIGNLRHLMRLSLAYNKELKMGEEGAVAIANGCTSLRDLDLSGNALLPGDAAGILSAFSHSKTLRILRLGDATIGSEGLRSLNTLHSLKSLRNLFLNGTYIGDENARAVSYAGLFELVRFFIVSALSRT